MPKHANKSPEKPISMSSYVPGSVSSQQNKTTWSQNSLPLSTEQILEDYKTSFISRQVSLLSRKEVLSGKAKFGIFGDGKEVVQVSLARALKKGDWRSGYYRDQTLMLALGEVTTKQLFAQVYADSDVQREPMSAGRQMNAHFATRLIDPDGTWKSQRTQFNTAADLSPTAAQMGRLVGLGYASKLYRLNTDLHTLKEFSDHGNEIALATIGNASTAEGIFWESLNACGVLQVPVAIFVWDDDYGISVPNKYQMTKESISSILQGFNPDSIHPGVDIYKIEGWNYPKLCQEFMKALEKVRQDHKPALFHVVELTQPQGHSTSGSHERYKSKERLAYELEHDCLTKMRAWIIDAGITSDDALITWEKSWEEEVKSQRNAAWQEYQQPIIKESQQFLSILNQVKINIQNLSPPTNQVKIKDSFLNAIEVLNQAQRGLQNQNTLLRRQIAQTARRVAISLAHLPPAITLEAKLFAENYVTMGYSTYRSHLHSESLRSPLNFKKVSPHFGEKTEMLAGHEIMQKFFDYILEQDPRVFIIGEDVGVLGDVNQNFKGLQERFGDLRLTDTGIREATILGQGIGAALRGLRPLVDIQYLDYLLYCFQLLSDDLASLHYRSAGGQIAPVIVRTKGHRLEGIWHSGSPLGTIINGVRGLHVAVPRNFVQTAGIYRTILDGDDPALVIEVLNGYRLKEAVPSNLGEYRVPLGVPEVVAPGDDITLVTYGACVRVALEAAEWLKSLDISLEVIDVQTLLPFDIESIIKKSLLKTHAVIFMDEDVPGGASAFMMQQVLETQDCFDLLEIPPKTITAPPNRPAYGSDGDYFCKPTPDDVIEVVYDMMRERSPHKFPARMK
jgi:pyruvate/2-oxoglutarate/acetoin dehydrogenase E1 component/TPP-dependent pyruvate/acetoin dehydrogenase alpha subunit